jgi:hypothetical protein
VFVVVRPVTAAGLGLHAGGLTIRSSGHPGVLSEQG